MQADEQEYQLTFEGRWTSNLPRPGSAHFSPLIGAVHNADGSIFAVGELASPGIENVAELGATSTLAAEINDGIAAGNVAQLITRSGNVGPVQTVTLNFTATGDHTLLSLVTMIAPSPDWFVGVHDLDLKDANGQWQDQMVIDINSYDAGTEEGSSFSLNNPPTNPQDVIQALDKAVPDNPLFGAGSIARVTLTRTVANPVTVFPRFGYGGARQSGFGRYGRTFEQRQSGPGREPKQRRYSVTRFSGSYRYQPDRFTGLDRLHT